MRKGLLRLFGLFQRVQRVTRNIPESGRQGVDLQPAGGRLQRACVVVHLVLQRASADATLMIEDVRGASAAVRLIASTAPRKNLD